MMLSARGARAVAVLAVAGWVLAFGTASPVVAGAEPRPPLRLAAMSDVPADADPTAAQVQAAGEPMPFDRAALEQAKAAPAPAASTETVAGTSEAPAVIRSFEGVSDASLSPSDSTGAVGTTRYIELVNARFGIYTKTSDAPIATGTLEALGGVAASHLVFDPQIIWDPTTNRFYYAMVDAVNIATNLLLVGYSKTASPSSAADWCKYNLNYGSIVPDYPKLGDTAAHTVVGINAFNAANAFVGSDIVTISKPPAGTGCPPVSSFTINQRTDIQTSSGAAAFTPVPANQTDTNTVGWVVARPGVVPASSIQLFRVTDGPGASATIQGPRGTALAVPSYNVPINAPQQGSSRRLDTSDTRMTQAVSGIDPVRANKVGLWTQHTTSGGAGAEVRWYEINPVAPALLQSGRVTSPSRFTFNGAISPDRAVAGTNKRFGGNMAITFNQSSATSRVTIGVASKVGTAAPSAPMTVVAMTGPYADFTCPGGSDVCRWGDYAGATPDPNPPAGAAGRVWATNQYGVPGGTGTANWRTRNIAVRP